jgi:DNA-binding MarR family transcriptional regulator
MGPETLQSRTGEVLHDLFKEVFALQAALSRVMDRVHEETGLSTPQRKVMQVLNHLGSATVPDIAARLGVSRQSIQVVCNDLLSHGLIEFMTNPRHKRSKLAALTANGNRAYEMARQNEYAAIEHILGRIDADAAEGARQLLAQIRNALETEKP